jgi:hypothetical protein
MQPQPDFGEDSYRGSGRLKSKAALITGDESSYITGEVVGVTGGKPLS